MGTRCMMTPMANNISGQCGGSSWTRQDFILLRAGLREEDNVSRIRPYFLLIIVIAVCAIRAICDFNNM
ncbi:unnamed protein product [Merluccius merluccius]